MPRTKKAETISESSPQVNPLVIEQKEKINVDAPKIIVMIDPKRTNGGIRVNGKLKVGKVVCRSQEEADDLLRIQEEYAAAFDKLRDPSIKLRNQSIETSRKAFIADPAQFAGHPRFSKVYGMLDPWQWQFVPQNDRLEWQEERMGLYNY